MRFEDISAYYRWYNPGESSPVVASVSLYKAAKTLDVNLGCVRKMKDVIVRLVRHLRFIDITWTH